MSFLSKFCCCFAPIDRSPHRLSCPYEYPVPGGYQGGDVQNRGRGNGNVENDPYASTVQLPRYTPHPTGMNEKTLEFQRPARSSWASLSETRNPAAPMDEKSPNEFRYENSTEAQQNQYINSNHYHHHRRRSSDDQNSDASSTLSYPSSYGNTSTATTESPPPPYSPHPSPPPGGSIMSMSLHCTGASQSSDDPPSPIIHIPQPQPVLHRAQFLHQAPVNDVHERRRSGEERNSASLPPIYLRRN